MTGPGAAAWSGTVEERIFELQDWKRGLVEGIMGQSDMGSTAGAKITKEHMEFLMGRRASLESGSSEEVLSARRSWPDAS